MLVHMAWTGSPPPRRVTDAVAAARKAAPACDVMFHADESAVPESWREAMDRLGLAPHMRSDVQRHAILKRHGGLWLDSDVRVLADPSEWASGWDRYTAVKMRDAGSMIATDLIYVPSGWPGWALVDAYIDGFIREPPQRYDVLHLAGSMIARLARQHADLFSILKPGDLFPFSVAAYTTEAVVARGFDPEAATPRPAMGLGDMAAAALGVFGITDERVSRVLGRQCHCPERREAMNAFGRRFGIG